MPSAQPQSADIYQLFAADLRRYISRRVDGTAVDDLVQETFLRIHKNLDGLRDQARISGWVFQVARSAVVDHFRRTRELLHEPGAVEVVDTTTLEHVDAGDPKRLAAWLSAAVERLPEPYREAIDLVDRQGLSQPEAARRLGLSVSGLKSRVQRGRAKLRQALKRCCEVELDRRGKLVDYRRRGCGPCCG